MMSQTHAHRFVESLRVRPLPKSKLFYFWEFLKLYFSQTAGCASCPQTNSVKLMMDYYLICDNAVIDVQ